MATEVISAEEMREPIIRRKTVSVSNDGSMMAVHDFGEYGHFVTDEPVAHGGTGEGPSPLQTVLGALCGCESVTFHRTSKEMGFAYEGIEFEAAFTIDIRGRLGMREVRPHYQTVRVQATVHTNESEERLAQVVEETENRCPVFNLLVDADVNLEMLWVRQPLV
jgi:putative redox protein